MGKVVMFASGKGGTGKTTAVSAIGSCLALQGERVICIDADPLGGLDLSMGVSDRCVWDLADAISGTCKISEALVSPVVDRSTISNLRYCRLGDALKRISILTRHFKRHSDWVLIDSPSGILETDVKVDFLVMVVNTDQSYYRAAAQIRELFNADKQLLIVNRVKEKLLRRFKTTLDDAIDGVGARLLGYIEEDETVQFAAISGTPLMLYNRQAGDSIAQKAYESITERLVNMSRSI